MTALSNETLPTFANLSPPYSRDNLVPSILHIGFGNFHRAHLAVYIDALLRAGNRSWSIAGCGVLASDSRMRDVMSAQDNLYTLVISRAPRIIGSVTRYIYAHPDPHDLLAAIASPHTQIISMTITEAGYPVDANGSFDPTSGLAAPGAAFGLLVKGLEARRAAAAGGITVLSCDNITGNGDVARAAALGMARKLSLGDVVAWVADGAVTFPNSMVDRITPATGGAERRFVNDLGIADAWPVFAEPFCQWVLEDAFGGARLPLEDMDVVVTADVRPYEAMKLRLLNAGHCCLAYPAALLGIGIVHEAMGDGDIRRFVRRFLETEAGPAVDAPPGMDVGQYTESLLERFSNPFIVDQVSRLCLHGSAKLPKFLLPTVKKRLEQAESVAFSAMMLAMWCQYLLGQTESGAAIELPDDDGERKAGRHAQASRGRPEAFLEYRDVFGESWSQDRAFVAAFTEALEVLRRDGARASIQSLVSRKFK